MPDLKLIGICLDELFDNRRYEVEVAFLAMLTSHHQLIEWKIFCQSVETTKHQ